MTIRIIRTDKVIYYKHWDFESGAFEENNEREPSLFWPVIKACLCECSE